MNTIFKLVVTVWFIWFGTMACMATQPLTSPKNKNTSPAEKNIFSDQTLRRIYTLQNERNTNELLVFLKDKNPVYRRAAVTAFASVQDPGAVETLVGLLSDENEKVRAATAYSLGQCKSKNAESYLVKAYSNEKSGIVKRSILEALGKCGTVFGQDFVVSLPGEKSKEILEGQALGIYRYTLKNVYSPRGTELAFELLKQTVSSDARLIAAHYLTRTRTLDLTSYTSRLIELMNSIDDVNIRMVLAAALAKSSDPSVLEYLKKLVLSNIDYRIRVNAARSLGRFEYSKIKDILFQLLSDPNGPVAVATSEYFLINGQQTDAEQYFILASKLSHCRVRGNMLTAAYTFSTSDTVKEKILKWILDAYTKSSNVYEKANFLTILGNDPKHFAFVENQVFSNLDKYPVISSTGFESLANMCVVAFNAKNEELLKSMVPVFKKALETGDASLINSAANAMRSPQMDLKRFFPDINFVAKALEKCKLPRDIDAWLELKRALKFFQGEEPTVEKPQIKSLPIDWDLVSSISPDQKVIVKTSKGNITIRLFVNEAPGSVSNFIRLIKENFYKNSMFHRVVPNFVIQDGCPRGDGSGGPDYIIGSELGPLYYGEGFVGMASSGKDTEGSQWFITHSPSPHLDGNYSIFGVVVSGMEVVHLIEVGDKILEFQIL